MSLLVTLLVLLATTALLAWGVAAWVLRRAEALRLVQMPNHRSSHDCPTPNGGGLGIVVAGSLAGIALVLLSGWMVGGLLLGLAAVLAAVGLRDNMAHLPARVRFGVQVVVCAGGLIAQGDLPAMALSGGLAFQVTGWVLFGDAGEPVPSPSLLVQPWQAASAEPEAQVWVLTGNGEGERAESALWAGDYRWLKVETDGQAQWLSKKVP